MNVNGSAEALSNVIIMLITEASSMVVIVLLITLRLRQWLFCWSHRGHWHGCDGSVDHIELYLAVTVPLITLKPPLWLWWFCWSHWSLVYCIVVIVLLITLKPRLLLWWFCHTETSSMVVMVLSHWSLVYDCDGSVDHTETSSMVVMVLSYWCLVYGCDGSVDHTETSSMVWWFCHTEASSVGLWWFCHTEASSMVVMVLLAPGSSFQAPDLYDKITKSDLFNQNLGAWSKVWILYTYGENLAFGKLRCLNSKEGEFIPCAISQFEPCLNTYSVVCGIVRYFCTCTHPFVS